MAGLLKIGTEREEDDLLAGLDTTEIGYCGTADFALVHRPWTSAAGHIVLAAGPETIARAFHHPSGSAGSHPGCYSCCSPEAGISCCSAADSNTGRRHLRLLDCRPTLSHAGCCSLRDRGTLDHLCHILTGCFGISESIELTFCTRKTHTQLID